MLNSIISFNGKHITKEQVNNIISSNIYKVVGSLEPQKFIIFDNYIKDNKLLNSNVINAYNIVLRGLYSIKYDYLSNRVRVYIDNSIILEKGRYKNIYLSDMCSLIDNGALGLPGTHIFTNLFNDIRTGIRNFKAKSIKKDN